MYDTSELTLYLSSEYSRELEKNPKAAPVAIHKGNPNFLCHVAFLVINILRIDPVALQGY